MPLIYALNAPLDPEGKNIEFLNIFRVDVEVHRNASTYNPKLDVYFAACDANGTERMELNAEGKPYPIAPSFKQFKFNETSPAVRDAFKQFLQAIYAEMSPELEEGQPTDV